MCRFDPFLKAPAKRRPWLVTTRVMGNLGWEKQVLAWWLCQHTTVRRRWVSKRLDRDMGDESRVTHAIRGVKQEAQPGVRTLKRKLEQSIETNR